MTYYDPSSAPVPQPFPTYDGALHISIKKRPSGLTAAAVLGFIAAVFQAICTMTLLAGAGETHGLSWEGWNSTRLTVSGLWNVAVAGLLLGSGIALLARKDLGRPLLYTAATNVLLQSIYWIASAHEGWGSALFLTFGFLVPLTISVCFVAGRTADRWFATAPAAY